MKKIGFWTALALVIGNIIGAGIFTTTGYLADKITNPGIFLAAWAAGGLYAVCGAFVYGLLSKRMPVNGGDYVYLKESFHPYFAYLFGWSGLFITYTGSIAALAIGAAHYINDLAVQYNMQTVFWNMYFFQFNFYIDGIKLAAFLLIIIFTYINHLGIRSGGRTQFLLTTAIVLLLTGFVAAGLFSGAHSLVIPEQSTSAGLTTFFSALPAVLFTYMGWTTIVYIAGEVKQPGRTIPAALIIGVIIVTALYFGLNYVFLSTASAAELAGQVNVTSQAADRLWGSGASIFVAAMIVVAILSSLNSTILSGPRIYQTMAKDRYLWKNLGKLHDKYETPHAALWIQAGWSIALLFSGTFNELLTMVVAAILVFSILTAFAAVKIMVRESYNIWYWIAAVTYIVLCFLVLLSILFENSTESFWGFLLLLISLPFYLIQHHKLNLQ